MAKRRFGEAARFGIVQSFLQRAHAQDRRWSRQADAKSPTGPERRSANAGFTLVELLIVIGIMPLVVGALAVGIVSVLSLQTTVSSRLSDSADAQVTSIDFDRDVQSAISLTTSSSSQNPAQCGTGFAVLGLQLGNSTEITYAVAQDGSTYTLSRNLCTLSGGTPSLQSSVVVGHDLPASVTNPASPPVSIPQCSLSPPAQIPACDVVGTGPAYETNWVSPLGITGVDFNTTEPGSKYTYQLTAVPNAAANSVTLSTPSSSSTPGGTFAVPGTGTYASTLFFVNFSNWNNQTASSGVSCTDGALPMAAAIADSPDTLSFCMSVSATTSTGAITGTSSAPAACGVAARTGWNDITAVPLPTYSCPPTSEAYLGNNGFYTVPPTVSGNCPTPSTQCPFDPGLYTVVQGSTAVITLTNIEIVSSTGVLATGWNLVTGDAESTDSGESLTWQSTPSTSTFTLIPNSVNPTTGAVISDIGNACMGAPPTNIGMLTGLGTTKVECTASVSRDKTGTPMLEVTTPSSLTMTLVGTGLQAVFLGVLLP